MQLQSIGTYVNRNYSDKNNRVQQFDTVNQNFGRVLGSGLSKSAMGKRPKDGWYVKFFLPQTGKAGIIYNRKQIEDAVGAESFAGIRAVFREWRRGFMPNAYRVLQERPKLRRAMKFNPSIFVGQDGQFVIIKTEISRRGKNVTIRVKGKGADASASYKHADAEIDTARTTLIEVLKEYVRQKLVLAHTQALRQQSFKKAA